MILHPTIRTLSKHSFKGFSVKTTSWGPLDTQMVDQSHGFRCKAQMQLPVVTTTPHRHGPRAHGAAFADQPLALGPKHDVHHQPNDGCHLHRGAPRESPSAGVSHVVQVKTARAHNLHTGVEKWTNVCQRGFVRTVHVLVNHVEQIGQNPLKPGGDAKAGALDNVRSV